MIIKIDLSHENIEKITGEKLRGLSTDLLNIDLYDRDSLEFLEENDEINCIESGFMSGYIGA